MFFRKKKSVTQQVDIDADLEAVKSFIKEVGGDIKNIFYLCQEMQSLRAKEKEMNEKGAPQQSLRKNLEQQATAWDKMLTVYKFFDEDVDVNSERIKKIAQDLRSKAKDIEMDAELKQKMKSEPRWTFNW